MVMVAAAAPSAAPAAELTRQVSHEDWLRSMHREYAALKREAESPTSVLSPLPPPPAVWAFTEPEDDVDALRGGFAAQSLGNDVELDFDDAPVYRSFSVAMFGATGSAVVDYDDFEDPPVYRSLSGFGVEPAPEQSPPSTPPAVEQRWLESMPPLVKRQRACVGSMH